MSRIVGMDGQAPPEANINIKPEDLDNIVCESCEGRFFRQIHAFKRLSALISPTGKEQIVPVPSFRCDDCGHINEEFRPK